MVAISHRVVLYKFQCSFLICDVDEEELLLKLFELNELRDKIERELKLLLLNDGVDSLLSELRELDELENELIVLNEKEERELKLLELLELNELKLE